MKRLAAACALSLLFSASLASGQVDQQRESAADDVAPAVAQRARSIAEGSPQMRNFLAAPRTVFIGVDVVRGKDDDGGREPAPLHRVRHYRYGDDTTVTSLVDVRSGRVVEQTEARNAAVPLSVGEFEEARALALADRRVMAAVGSLRERLVVEPLVVRTSDASDAWHGRRVVRLLFRVGADYLSNPVVHVDLTSRQVIVQPPHRPERGD
ncbi:MAG: hypothetical protein QOI38_674 [Sphingomonadales bacterium]|jgi:hypothetical protein|nr:hypothetical protein [Sphingomonadales bacterium]